MLARRASSAFVCFRCQLKFARKQSIPSLSRQTPHANISSLHALRNNDTSFKRIRIRKNHRERKLRETSTPLGVDTLGQPAEIIVLRDATREKPARNTQPSDTTQENPAGNTQPSDAPETSLVEADHEEASFEAFTDETESPDQAELIKRLNSLRPPTSTDSDEPLYLPQAEFVRFYNRLSEGFTVQQLSRYFSDITGINKRLAEDEINKGSAVSSVDSKKAQYLTEWRPGKTSIRKRLPAILPTLKGKRTGVSKEVVIDQILRSAWNIVPLEEVESPGELEVYLKRWQLLLLSSGAAPTPLDVINERRNANFATYLPHNVIRITADKSSAEYAASDIESLLANSERLALDLDHWRHFLQSPLREDKAISHFFSQEDFSTVQSITGAVLQRVSSDRILLRGLSKKQVEDAQRCLVAMLPFRLAQTRDIFTNAASDQGTEGSFYPNTFKQALDYQERKLNLGRWTLPVTRAAQGEGSATDTGITGTARVDPQAPFRELQKRVLHSLQESLTKSAVPKRVKLSSDQDLLTSQKQKWSKAIVTSISAQFGQILHSLKASESVGAPLREQQVESGSGSVFVDTTPGLPRLLQSLKSSNDTGTDLSEELEYQFIPSRAPHPDDGTVYPKLVVRVSVQPGGSIDLRGVALVIQEHLTDVSLPDLASDIRFKKTETLWLYNALANESIQQLYDFICANIASGERLTAPSNVPLEVPFWAVSDAERDMEKQLQRNGSQHVQYFFTGIEHRQTVHVPFPPHKLRFSTIQAGQLGGKRAALELHYNGPERLQRLSTIEDFSDRLQGFIRSSFAVARKIELASHATGPMRKKKHSEEEPAQVQKEISASPLFSSGEPMPLDEAELSQPSEPIPTDWQNTLTHDSESAELDANFEAPQYTQKREGPASEFEGFASEHPQRTEILEDHIPELEDIVAERHGKTSRRIGSQFAETKEANAADWW